MNKGINIIGGIAAASLAIAAPGKANADGILALGQGGVFEVKDGQATLVVPTDATSGQVRARTSDILLGNAEGYFRSRPDLSGFDSVNIKDRTALGTMMPLDDNNLMIIDSGDDKVEIADVPPFQGEGAIVASYNITDPNEVDSFSFNGQDGKEYIAGGVATGETKNQKIWFFYNKDASIQSGFVDLNILNPEGYNSSYDLECLDTGVSVTCIVAYSDTANAVLIDKEALSNISDQTDLTSNSEYVPQVYVDSDWNNISEFANDGNNFILGAGSTQVLLHSETLEPINVKELTDVDIFKDMAYSPTDNTTSFLPNNSLGYGYTLTLNTGETLDSDQPQKIIDAQTGYNLRTFAFDVSGNQWYTPDADRDGVADNKDNCPDTVPGAEVDDKGCEIVEGSPTPTPQPSPTPEDSPTPDVSPTPDTTTEPDSPTPDVESPTPSAEFPADFDDVDAASDNGAEIQNTNGIQIVNEGNGEYTLTVTDADADGEANLAIDPNKYVLIDSGNDTIGVVTGEEAANIGIALGIEAPRAVPGATPKTKITIKAKGGARIYLNGQLVEGDSVTVEVEVKTASTPTPTPTGGDDGPSCSVSPYTKDRGFDPLTTAAIMGAAGLGLARRRKEDQDQE